MWAVNHEVNPRWKEIKMKFKHVKILVMMVGMVVSALSNAAEEKDATAEAVFAIASATSGGAAWDKITTIKLESTFDSEGTKGTYKLKVVLLPSPRESAGIQMGQTHMTYGWDGQQRWDLDPTGMIRVQTISQEIAERRSAVYTDVIGY